MFVDKVRFNPILIPIVVPNRFIERRLEAAAKGIGRYILRLSKDCVKENNGIEVKVFEIERIMAGNIMNVFCRAGVYERTDGKVEKLIGVIFFTRIVETSDYKPLLRMLGKSRAIISISPKEGVLVAYILGLSPTVNDFCVWLVTGL